MKLTERNPRWIGRDGTFTNDPTEGGCGVAFDCPNCGGVIAVNFDKPLDGGPSRQPNHCWARTGETFETLTLQPSILERIRGDADFKECWHGYVTNGAIVTV